jgi:hypothetical protein
MALNLVHVPSPKPGIAMVEVPADVAEELEGAYQVLREKGGEIKVEFPTVEELNTFTSQARYWADSHTPTLKFRQLPSKKLPDNVIRFRISLDTESKDEKATEKTDEKKDSKK